MTEFYFGVSYPFKMSHIEYFVLTGQKMCAITSEQSNYLIS